MRFVFLHLPTEIGESIKVTLNEELFRARAQYLYAAVDLPVGRGGEVQPERVRNGVLVAQKRVAGHYRDLIMHRLRAEFVHIVLIGHGRPDEQSALRLGIGDARGHTRFKSVRHTRVLLTVDLL